MLIKTIVDENFEGAFRLEHSVFDKEKDETVSVGLWVAEVEYDSDFVQKLTEEISGWYVRKVSIFDYESSTDAGDGRDDYSKEETEEEIDPGACIVKDGSFAGIICEAFGVKKTVLTDGPGVWIGHPGNYSGRGYHFYRTAFFELLSRA